MKKHERDQAAALERLLNAIESATHANGFMRQRDAAELLGVSQQYYSDMMNGRRPWTPERLTLLGDKLRIDVKYWHELGARAAGWRL